MKEYIFLNDILSEKSKDPFDVYSQLLYMV